MNLLALGRHCLFAAGLFGSAAGLFVTACGSSSDSVFVEDGGGSSGSSGFGGDGSDPFGSSSGGPDAGDITLNDPFPPWCGPDGGQPAPPPPGGTEACPDDKNLKGCGCSKLGEKAKCWPGLRKQRNIGLCKEGETTCVQKNETELAWGDCVGAVLPTPGATKGAAACACFSAGQWKIANISPCTLTITQANGDKSYTAISTFVKPDGTLECGGGGAAPPTTAPTEDWSTDTLKVDCAGHFKLCLRIRQGVFETPDPTKDCLLAEVCTESDYKVANVEQAWPNLPGWIGKDPACAAKWAAITKTSSPGYAEMVVKGQSVRCDNIDDGNGGDLIFNRLKYCPESCNEPANANLPECVACQQSGAGQF